MDRVAQFRQLRGYDSYRIRLGDLLRGERATRGKSLLEVQRDLRIKASYIAAIEDADPSVFPNPGYIAGYVRSYARYLGLEPDDIFRQFCDESGYKGVNSSLASARANDGAAARQAAAGAGIVIRPVAPAGLAPRRRLADIPLGAIGSVAVLVMLIGALGFGGLKVIENIQRVELAPVDRTPGALDAMPGLASPGYSMTVELDGAVAEVTDAAAAATAADGDSRDLARLYQPRELEVPVVVSRDGPVVDIDPDQVGAFRPDPTALAAAAPAKPASVAMAEVRPDFIGPLIPAGMDPMVREAVLAPAVSIVASIPAWVRVYLPDGTVLFEKVLEQGEHYDLPSDVAAPLMRSGNSGYVYLVVNGQTFGPVGKGTGVAKNVSLMPDDIRMGLSLVAEPPEELQATISAMMTSEIEGPTLPQPSATVAP